MHIRNNRNGGVGGSFRDQINGRGMATTSRGGHTHYPTGPNELDQSGVLPVHTHTVSGDGSAHSGKGTHGHRTSEDLGGAVYHGHSVYSPSHGQGGMHYGTVGQTQIIIGDPPNNFYDLSHSHPSGTPTAHRHGTGAPKKNNQQW